MPIVLCDVAAIEQANAEVLDMLAQLQLAAGRIGCELLLTGAADDLRDLIGFAGLCDVLRVEPRRQPEEGKERLRVEEERQLDDLPA